ncbi:MAG TPA: branched-chain amino acid aminotransferase [Streptosporangiaceae bacterium]|jgi:branched-chain amino acid aminotransferase
MTAGPDPEITFAVHPATRPVSDSERARLLAAPGFGDIFTDHMVTLRYSPEHGWHDGRLEPYGPLSLDPATAVFHYGQEIFEGLKAYRQPAGPIVLFRPWANAARFRRSATRMAMPELPEEAFVHAVELLVSQDRDWVPTTPDHSLYVRPFMIATHRGLGVSAPSSTYLFTVIASPAASYFSGGIRSVRVWLADGYSRAAPGGTGAAKTGGNYAASFAGQSQAIEHGCDQVVWLDAVEGRWVEEMGGMNMYFVYGSGDRARIVTPALTGSLLPGITRDALLSLAPTLGIPAAEGAVSAPEWRAGCGSGEITEAFACGTAAVITPVGEVDSVSGGWTIGDGSPGPVTMRLREALLGLQFGQQPDPHAWVHKVC